MTHTLRKENWVKKFEPALRHIYKLNKDDYIRFNNNKTRLNGQADLIIFDRKNASTIYLKVFCSYEQCFYSVALDQYKKITEKNPLNKSRYSAEELDKILLTNGTSFTLLTIDQLEKAKKFLKKVSDIENLCLPPDQFNNYGFESKDIFVENQIPKRISEKRTIPEDSFLMSDHRLGKLFAIIDNDSISNGGNGNPLLKDINDFTNSVWGITDETNVKAKAAFNKQVRRYIKKMQDYFENGYKLEPLSGIWNQNEINVFIFPLEMINIATDSGKADLLPFFQYQNSHNRKVNKTEDIKAYKKAYYNNHKR